MAANKDKKIQIRVNADTKRDFELLAVHRGLTPTAILHSYIVKTVHDAKKEMPEIFNATERSDVAPADKSEKISVIARSKNKKEKSKETLSTRKGEIPLVDEASSVEEDGD